jgi:hypothetical protein
MVVFEKIKQKFFAGTHSSKHPETEKSPEVDLGSRKLAAKFLYIKVRMAIDSWRGSSENVGLIKDVHHLLEVLSKYNDIQLDDNIGAYDSAVSYLIWGLTAVAQEAIEGYKRFPDIHSLMKALRKVMLFRLFCFIDRVANKFENILHELMGAVRAKTDAAVEEYQYHPSLNSLEFAVEALSVMHIFQSQVRQDLTSE